MVHAKDYYLNDKFWLKYDMFTVATTKSNLHFSNENKVY
jgi:hypothetical protein